LEICDRLIVGRFVANKGINCRGATFTVKRVTTKGRKEISLIESIHLIHET
jgi:hypothetical protein